METLTMVSVDRGAAIKARGALANVLSKKRRRLLMISKKTLCHLTFAALCGLSSLSHASEEPSVTMERPGAGVKEIKEGDNAPDQYQRDSLAIKDWDKHHLSAPGKNQQWVEIKDKYALIDIPTGTIKKMVDKR
jgi:Ni/Co efflux regulator RcnB